MARVADRHGAGVARARRVAGGLSALDDLVGRPGTATIAGGGGGGAGLLTPAAVGCRGMLRGGRCRAGRVVGMRRRCWCWWQSRAEVLAATAATALGWDAEAPVAAAEEALLISEPPPPPPPLAGGVVVV